MSGSTQLQLPPHTPEPRTAAAHASRPTPPSTEPLRAGKDHYLGRYLSLPRMISYWYQATEVRRCGGRQVLEVGIGLGLTTWLLRRWGLEVATLDVDPSLEPTYVGDVRALPCADGQFDTVLAAEVLEHLPYCDFEQSLRELQRVARRNVVLTLPCPLVGFHAGLNLPLLKPLFLACGLPRCSSHRFDGQHYWELGRRGYPKRRIRRSIRAAGLTIAREYRPGLSLYSYFFVLTRQP